MALQSQNTWLQMVLGQYANQGNATADCGADVHTIHQAEPTAEHEGLWPAARVENALMHWVCRGMQRLTVRESVTPGSMFSLLGPAASTRPGTKGMSGPWHLRKPTYAPSTCAAQQHGGCVMPLSTAGNWPMVSQAIRHICTKRTMPSHAQSALLLLQSAHAAA
jgi:hypothetical protein